MGCDNSMGYGGETQDGMLIYCLLVGILSGIFIMVGINIIIGVLIIISAIVVWLILSSYYDTDSIKTVDYEKIKFFEFKIDPREGYYGAFYRRSKWSHKQFK